MAKRRSARKASPAQSRNSRMPLGVRIISILSYVLAVALLAMSIFMFGAGALLSTEDAQALVQEFVEDTTASTTIASGFTLAIVLGGILFLAFAALFFFIGRGLARGQRWARITMIIIAALGFVGALADILRGDILSNLADLIIDGWIAGYLLFSKKVQAAFR